MGYTPAFDTIYTGTLYGRWPAAPVWASLLPLLSRHGEIDMSVEAICGMTGWPRELLLEGIRQLMEPDPYSRTPGHNGVRLELLVEGRPWGWRAVNHGVYREKARKMNYDADRTQSGKDAERKRQSREVPRSPATSSESRAVPLSDSDSDSDSDVRAREEKIKTPAANAAPPKGGRARGSKTVPDDFELSQQLREFALAELPDLDIEAELSKFRDHEFQTTKVDWVRTWRRWVRTAKTRGDYARKSKSGGMMFAGKPVEWA